VSDNRRDRQCLRKARKFVAKAEKHHIKALEASAAAQNLLQTLVHAKGRDMETDPVAHVLGIAGDENADSDNTLHETMNTQREQQWKTASEKTKNLLTLVQMAPGSNNSKDPATPCHLRVEAEAGTILHNGRSGLGGLDFGVQIDTPAPKVLRNIHRQQPMASFGAETELRTEFEEECEECNSCDLELLSYWSPVDSQLPSSSQCICHFQSGTPPDESDAVVCNALLTPPESPNTTSSTSMTSPCFTSTYADYELINDQQCNGTSADAGAIRVSASTIEKNSSSFALLYPDLFNSELIDDSRIGDEHDMAGHQHDRQSQRKNDNPAEEKYQDPGHSMQATSGLRDTEGDSKLSVNEHTPSYCHKRPQTLDTTARAGAGVGVLISQGASQNASHPYHHQHSTCTLGTQQRSDLPQQQQHQHQQHPHEPNEGRWPSIRSQPNMRPTLRPPVLMASSSTANNLHTPIPCSMAALHNDTVIRGRGSLLSPLCLSPQILEEVAQNEVDAVITAAVLSVMVKRSLEASGSSSEDPFATEAVDEVPDHLANSIRVTSTRRLQDELGLSIYQIPIPAKVTNPGAVGEPVAMSESEKSAQPHRP
jgi:hypothetical protein